MEQTTARLRKTFGYPLDGEFESESHEAIDEEGLSTLHHICHKGQSSAFFTDYYTSAHTNTKGIEQDSIIRKMKEDNAERNKQYNTALFSFSLVANLPYLTTLFTRQTALLSLLSISSLLSTAYLIYCTQPGKTGIAFLDKSNMHLKPQSMAASKEAMLQAIDGPIKLYLPYLNIGLCFILVALGCVANRKEVELWWGFEWLPAAVYTVAITAKWIMGGVDPEEELGRLRYELKGA